MGEQVACLSVGLTCPVLLLFVSVAGLCVPSHGVQAAPASPCQEPGQLEHSAACAGENQTVVSNAQRIADSLLWGLPTGCNETSSGDGG